MSAVLAAVFALLFGSPGDASYWCAFLVLWYLFAFRRGDA